MQEYEKPAVMFVQQYGATFIGFMLAFFMALWRTAQSKGKADWLEASMCAGLTLGIASALDWLGLPRELAIFVGSFVGYMGVHKVGLFISKKIKFEGKDK